MPSPVPILSDSARGFRALPLIARAPRREPQVPVLGRAARVHLWHTACQMNDADREDLAAQLADIGCIPEAALEDADIAVLITCTVRANAEQTGVGMFRELIPWKRERP